MKSPQDCFRLADGVEIPCLGFGTWQIEDENDVIRSVCSAVETGYRHIDTAAAYGNEKSIGKALKRCGVPREELFVTSKLWNTERGYETTLAAFETTMKDLRLDYLDLYLIHWPASPHRFPSDWRRINAETWRAFEKLHKEKRIRAVGVSNFLPHHLEALLETAEIVPTVDQIEFHPGCRQSECVDFCRKHAMQIEAWSPLGRGGIFSNAELKEMAGRYGKSVAQLCLRWCLQHDVLPLPKSTTPARIRENAELFDFEISPDDMDAIDRMPYFGGSGLDPDKVDF